MLEFAEIIENIEQIPFESQEILIDIINKRFSEIKRERFIDDTLESRNEFKNGDRIEGNSDNLFEMLKI